MSMKINGHRIRDLRLARSWSQETLAEHAGISLRTVQRVETEGIASLTTQRSIAAALQADISELAAPVPRHSARRSTAVEPPSFSKPTPPPARRSAQLRPYAAAAFAAIIAVTIGAVLWLDRTAPESPPPELQTATIDRGEVRFELIATGSMRPRQIVAARARTSGELVAIHVTVGDEVEEGKVLAAVDSNNQALAVQSARLSLQMLMNQVPLLESERQSAQTNLQSLSASAASRTSQQELVAYRSAEPGQSVRERQLREAESRLLKAEVALENMRLEIRQAEFALRQLETQLRYTDIRAPIAGTVITIDKAVGDIINTEQPDSSIVQIAELSTLNFVAEVPDGTWMNSLTPDTPASVRFQHFDQPREVSLQTLNPMPSSQRNKVAYEAVFDVDNADGDLYSGMTAELVLVTENLADALRVPRKALMDLQPGPAGTYRADVVIARVNGGNELRAIELGAIGNEYAEVFAGLAVGEQVILDADVVPNAL